MEKGNLIFLSKWILMRFQCEIVVYRFETGYEHFKMKIHQRSEWNEY